MSNILKKSKEVLILIDHKLIKSQWELVSSNENKTSKGLRSSSLL